MKSFSSPTVSKTNEANFDRSESSPASIASTMVLHGGPISAHTTPNAVVDSTPVQFLNTSQEVSD